MRALPGQDGEDFAERRKIEAQDLEDLKDEDELEILKIFLIWRNLWGEGCEDFTDRRKIETQEFTGL